MQSEWPLISIGSIARVFDGPHATPKKTTDGPVFLGISSLNRGQLDLSKTEHLSEADFAKWTKRVQPKEGDVVFSYETRLGQAAIIPSGLRCCLGRRMALVRTDRSKLLPRYFLYYFLSDEFQSLLRARTIHGSTVERLPLTEFPDYPVRVPPISVQELVIESLAALDDRIDLLRQTNVTLECIAQVLFKSWFIDFDPVRAKAEGREPEGMDVATAALFPAEFTNSALGLIPKGWQVSAIGDVVEEVFDGPHATPPEASEGPVFLGIKNLTGMSLDLSEIRHIGEDAWARWTRRVTPTENDIVFSYEAALGLFALIPPKLRCCLGRRLALVRAKPVDGTPHFWFHQFTGAPFQQLLAKHTVHGATVNRIALKEFPSYPVLDPGKAARGAFEHVAASLWARVHANQQQALGLAELRDTLLPRLISGKLRMPEAQEQVAEVIA